METENTKITEVVNRVEGFLSLNEGVFLYETAKKCSGKGVAVEIGSWKGKSTICLGLGFKAAAKLKFYAIDPHTGSAENRVNGKPVWTFDEFVGNLKAYGVCDSVNPLRETSESAAAKFGEKIELLFIDGAHDYDSVRNDFTLWSPFIIDGGIVAFHDSFAEGPRRLIREKIYRSSNFTGIGIAGSILYAKKVDDIGILGRVENLFLLLIDYAATIYYRFQIPGLRLNLRKRLMRNN